MAHIRADISTGRRLYIQTAFGEPVVEKLKDAGAKWDRDAKCWWVGTAKKAAIEEILVANDQLKDAGGGEAPARQDPHTIRLTGKGRYKGRDYFAGSITKDGQKVRLLTLPDAEGKYLDFWASCSEVEEIKRYEPREVWNGRRGGGTRTVYTTLGSIAEFVSGQKADRAAGIPLCGACGKSGTDLVRDLEDGVMKHRKCCDLEP